MKKPSPRVLSTAFDQRDSVFSNDECNCACSSVAFVDSWDVNMAADLQRAQVARSFELDGDWQGLVAPNGPSVLTVLNQPAYDLWSRFKSPLRLNDLSLNDHETQAVRDLAAAGLLRSQEARISHFPAQDQQLTAWLHITDRCNLRCAYCYLPHAAQDMSEETGRASVEAVFRSVRQHGYRRVKLKYAGGEPLLAFPRVLSLHRYAKHLAVENGIELDSVLLSNGTLLTDEITTELRDQQIRLMISLDGITEYHDAQRPYAGGRGSFKDTAAGVQMALKHHVTPHISITVSGRNAAGLADTVAWMLERRLPFSLNFYRENGFSRKHEDLRLEEEKIIAGMLSALQVIEDHLPDHTLLTSLIDRANLAQPHQRSCTVGCDYLVIDPQGAISRCHMQMSQAATHVRAPDVLEQIRAAQCGVQNPSVDEKEVCMECEWRYWCAGGCPLETFRATGRYDVQSPNCGIYQALFPAILRLEAMRLIKTYGASAIAL